MKKLIHFCLFLWLSVYMQITFAENSLTKEYKRFFNEKDYVIYKSGKIKINVDEDYSNSAAISVTIEFDLKGAEKILVLKVPESGYSDEGFYTQECRDDYVFVAGYTIEPTKNISEISFRMRSRCLGERTRIVVWAKTSNGKYYQGIKTFRIYAAHETLYW